VGDLAGRERATFWDLGGLTNASLRHRNGSIASGPRGWNVEDIERAASGGLLGEGLSRVMRDVVPIHDVVVPISLPGLECGTLEAEGTLPSTGFGGIF